VAVIEGGVVSYIRTDHIGRPVFATNSTTGVKTWTASYDPFGGVRTVTGAPISARFPGQWFQAESGLHQNWMRDYDPTTGRYLQADPLGLVDGASVYGYARQSPGRYVDPKGEYTSSEKSEPVQYSISSPLQSNIGDLFDQRSTSQNEASICLAQVIAVCTFSGEINTSVSGDGSFPTTTCVYDCFGGGTRETVRLGIWTSCAGIIRY
jgi:RHS repeat-associated protein